MKLLGKPIAVTPPDGFDVAGAGNVELYLTRQCLTLPWEGNTWQHVLSIRHHSACYPYITSAAFSTPARKYSE